MARKNRKIASLIAVMVVLVALFQFLWPHIYPWIVSRNPYPTREYYQIMGFVSPNGLSIITVVVGLIFIAWIAYTDP